MSDFKKERHNPIELIKRFWPDADTQHIIYDPTMKKGDYEIIRQSGGDGTLLFTIQMLQEALLGILNMQSWFKLTEPNAWEKVKAINYTIGTMRHVTVYGMIYLKCSTTHKYPGQRERIRMPVKCEYIMKNFNLINQ